MKETTLARTQRLIWRTGTPCDLDRLHDFACDFHLVRQTETWPWPADREFTKRRCLAEPSSERVSGVVCEGQTVVGYLLLGPGGKLGYLFGRRYWGRGYATEIGQAAVAFAFSRYAWPQLSACVFADNPASARVLQKLGFVERDKCRGTSLARGGVHPIRTFVRPRS